MGELDDIEIPFADGNVTGAVRVGATVRRKVGPSTPAIHLLLRHLERAGFAGAPRVLGFDAQGREVLSYIAGETNPNPLVSFASDAALAQVARLLREYHDATTRFVSPPDAPWRVQIGAPTMGDVICHNDIAPYNTIAADGRAVAFIDWDFAAPGPHVWDVAHALWRFVPLNGDPAFGTVAGQARWIELFCDAYGLAERDELLATIARRQQALYDSMAAWAAAGELAFVRLMSEGHGRMVLHDLDYLARSRGEFERVLETRE